MIERVIDVSRNTIKNVYSEHLGNKLTPFSDVILTDDDYIIISCSDIDLISKHLRSEKRIYVLLDNKITSKEYSHLLLSNVWFIKTDLSLPNLLLNDRTIYLLALNMCQDNTHIYKELKKYLKQLIIQFVKKQQGFDYDLLEEHLNILITHDSQDSMMKYSDYVISDIYDFHSLICSMSSKRLNQTFKQLDLKKLDPLLVVRNGQLNPVIVQGNAYIELKLNIPFNIEDYYYRHMYPMVTCEDAANQVYFDENSMKITVNPMVEVNSVIKVDLVKKDNQAYIENQIQQLITNHQINTPCLKVKFNIIVQEYAIEDFKIINQLSDKKIKEILNLNEQVEELVIFNTKEGLVAVVDELTDDLVNNKSIKYIIMKKEL